MIAEGETGVVATEDFTHDHQSHAGQFGGLSRRLECCHTCRFQALGRPVAREIRSTTSATWLSGTSSPRCRAISACEIIPMTAP